MKNFLVKKLANNLVTNKILASLGYKMQMIGLDHNDLPDSFKTLYRAVKPYTMCGEDSVYTMASLVDYIEEHDISGDIVECGVWRGGMMMAAALSLKSYDRHLYLYDTFTGMDKPNEDVDGLRSITIYNDSVLKDGTSSWCRAHLEDVTKNMGTCGYDHSKIHYIKGRVEDTIPSKSPRGDIAILRLDTDWYSSTKHELDHLFDKVVVGGAVIIDDYGAWQGSRSATDKFILERGLKYHLHRIDSSARYFIKY